MRGRWFVGNVAGGLRAGRVLMGQRLAATVAKVEGRGKSGEVAAARAARRRRRYWQVAAWSSKDSEGKTLVQSVQIDNPKGERLGGPVGGQRKALVR